MNAHLASLINAVAMIVMGIWGYSAALDKAPTALIPVFLGVILLVLSQGVKNENKAQAHIAVIITLLGLLALAMKPLMGAIDKYSGGDMMPLVRVGTMVVTNVISIVFFIRSFIQARKNRLAK